MLAAKAQNLTIHRHHLNAEKVVGRQPIFEAMHPARIFCDIAANRAGNLA